MKKIKFKFMFAWYDIWVGIFIDTKKKVVYIFNVTMLGIKIWKEEDNERNN